MSDFVVRTMIVVVGVAVLAGTLVAIAQTRPSQYEVNMRRKPGMKMRCVRVGELRRCENAEAICYESIGTGVSCVEKSSEPGESGMVVPWWIKREQGDRE